MFLEQQKQRQQSTSLGVHNGEVYKYAGTLFFETSEGEERRPAKKMASCQATRTNIAHVVVYAKTVVELDEKALIQNNTQECQVLWKMATESVFKLADKLDDSDNKK